jgi:hypothetical protein
MTSPPGNPRFFIVGCPRSGTTLLLRMLAAHPEVAVIPELGWIAPTYERRERLTADGKVTREFLEHLAGRGFGRFARLPLHPDELLALDVSGGELSYAALISLLFDRYGSERGRTTVGNKTVAAVRFLATLHELWPEAKLLHLIRDGRDVALSAVAWRRAARLAADFSTWRGQPFATAALWWEWNVRLGREAGLPLGPDLYREVRYETLAADPEGECRAVCDFLALSYDEAMPRFHEGRTREEPGLDAKHAWLAPTPGLRDWRTQMGAADVERFEAAAGGLLDELGYERGASEIGGEAAALAASLRERFEGHPLPARWGGRRAGARVA